MMPHTVPNRPMKGAAEPVVARNSRRASTSCISFWICTSITFSMRFWTPWKPARMAASWLRFHSRMAAMKMAASPTCRPVAQREVEIFERLARPEILLETVIGGVHLPHGKELLDDDRPAPHRRQGQPQHDELDDPARLHDQVPERNVRLPAQPLSTATGSILSFHPRPEANSASAAPAHHTLWEMCPETCQICRNCGDSGTYAQNPQWSRPFPARSAST